MEPLQAIIEQYQHIQNGWEEEIEDLIPEGEGSRERVIKLKAKVDILKRILTDLKTV
jgi:hypothetical protein